MQHDTVQAGPETHQHESQEVNEPEKTYQGSPFIHEDENWNGLSPFNEANRLHYEQSRMKEESQDDSSTHLEALPLGRKRHGSSSLMEPWAVKRTYIGPNRQVYMSHPSTPQNVASHQVDPATMRVRDPVFQTPEQHRFTTPLRRQGVTHQQYLPPPGPTFGNHLNCYPENPRSIPTYGYHPQNAQDFRYRRPVGSMSAPGRPQLPQTQRFSDRRSYNVMENTQNDASIRRSQSSAMNLLHDGSHIQRPGTVAPGYQPSHRTQQYVSEHGSLIPIFSNRDFAGPLPRNPALSTSGNLGSPAFAYANYRRTQVADNSMFDGASQGVGTHFGHDLAAHGNNLQEMVVHTQRSAAPRTSSFRAPIDAENFRNVENSGDDDDGSDGNGIIGDNGVISDDGVVSDNGLLSDNRVLSDNGRRGNDNGKDDDNDDNDEADVDEPLEAISKKALRKNQERKFGPASNVSHQRRFRPSGPRINFDGNRRSQSAIDSTCEGEANQPVYINEKGRRQRGGTPEIIINHASPDIIDLCTPPANGDIVRQAFPPGSQRPVSRNTSQRATPLSKAAEKENARQKKAAEKTFAIEKHGKQVKDRDELFDDMPPDEAAEARKQRLIEADAMKEQIRAEANVINTCNSMMKESLTVLRKQWNAEEREKRKSERRTFTEEEIADFQQQDEERLASKRLAAAKLSERERRKRDAAALRERFEAEKEAAKERAATLKPSKKTPNHTVSNSAVAAATLNCEDLIEIPGSGHGSDLGLFVQQEEVDALFKDTDKIYEDSELLRGDRSPELDQTVDTMTEARPLSRPVGAGISFTAIANDNRRNAPPRQRKTSLRLPPPPREAEQDTLVPSPPPPKVEANTTRIQKPRQGSRDTVAAERRLQSILEKKLADYQKSHVDSQEKHAKELADTVSRLETMITASAKIMLENHAGLTSSSNTQSDSNMSSHTSQANRVTKPLHPGYASCVTFLSQIEERERHKQKTEEARKKKYEKDKRSRKRRYETDVRKTMLTSNMEIDEETLNKQVDEKMKVWEETRKKREQKNGLIPVESSLTMDADSQNTATPENDFTMSSPVPVSNNDGANAEDPDDVQSKERERAIRAGVNFLASQKSGSSDFAKATAISRVDQLDSSESEEDPEDNSNVPAQTIKPPSARSDIGPIGLAINLSNIPSAEADEESDDDNDEDRDIDIPFPPDAFPGESLSLLPKVPKIPRTPKTTSQPLQPDISNPKEGDMIHIYKVRYMSEQDGEQSEIVTLNTLHSVEEANAFAIEKLAELHQSSTPALTGKSETYDANGMFMGKAITNTSEGDTELIWVTREISYIGLLANLTRKDLKVLVPQKVFNVMRFTFENDSADSDIIATTSIKSLANQKALDLFIQLARPKARSIDGVRHFDEVLVPAVRKKILEADDNDDIIEIDEYTNSSRDFAIKIRIKEGPVIGPPN